MQHTILEDHKYTTAVNRTYPDLNLYLYGMAASSEWKYLWADELGLRSTHLLEGIDRQSNTPLVKNFAYTYDSKGRPSNVVATSYNGKITHYLITYVEN